MARSKAEKKSKKSALTGDALERRRLVRRRMAHAGGIALLSGAMTVALVWSWRTTTRLATPDHPPKVMLSHQPDWMSPLLARKIIDQLEPSVTSSALDQSVLQDSNAILAGNPWVQEIHGIRRRYDEQTHTPGGMIEIDASFRTPVALIRNGGFFWLVDDAGTVLPDPFTDEQIRYVVRTMDGRINLRVITGVAQPPGRAGTPWTGKDVTAGLELVRALHGMSFAEEIVAIDVSNFGGRENRSSPHLELVTSHDTRLWWGRPIGGDDGLSEVAADAKLQKLDYLFTRYGRVDAGQRWVDLRFDTVFIPADPPAEVIANNRG